MLIVWILNEFIYEGTQKNAWFTIIALQAMGITTTTTATTITKN